MSVIGIEVYDELKKLFNLPERCRRLEIRLEVGSLVEIECEYFPEDGTGEPVTATFNLVPAEEQVKDVTCLEDKHRKFARIEPMIELRAAVKRTERALTELAEIGMEQGKEIAEAAREASRSIREKAGRGGANL